YLSNSGTRSPPSPKVSSYLLYCPQSLVIPVLTAVSGHLLYYVRSLWSSSVICPQSLVISCTMSAVSGHLLYYVRSLWSSPVLCPQSLVISCTVSAVSGHLLYYVRSLWSSPVLCLQSIAINVSCPLSLTLISFIRSAVSYSPPKHCIC
ncbi:unnamed protein product, partial [Staurois parvus]